MRKRRRGRRAEARRAANWPEVLGEAMVLAVVGIVPLVVSTGSTNPCDVKDAVLGLGVTAGLWLWLVASLRRGRLEWVSSRFNVVVIAFGLSAGLSLTYSRYWYVTISGFGRLAAHIGLYMLVIFYLRSAAQVRRVIAAACLAAVPVCVYGFVQAAGKDPIHWEAPPGRVFSLLGNATYLAGFLVLVIPLAAAAGWPRGSAEERVEGAARRRARVRMSVMFLGVTGMMLLCLYFSVTISPVIGLVVGGGVAGAISLARGGRRLVRKAAPWMLVGVVIAAGLGVVGYWRLPVRQQRRVQQVLHFQDPYGELRQMQWRVAFDLFRERPVLGFGYGTFRTYSLERLSAGWYADLGKPTEKMLVPSYAHNEYLEVLAGSGVVGGAIFLLLLGTMYATALRVSIRHRDDAWRGAGLAITAAMTAFVVQNFFGVTFRQTGAATVFWVWLAVLTAAGASLARTGEEGAGPRVREVRFAPVSSLGLTAIGLGLACVVGALGWYAVRPVMANMKLRQAKREVLMAEARPAAQKEARDKQLREAAELAEEAIGLSPYSAAAHYLAAYAWGQQGDYEKALAANKRAAELLPGSASIEYNMAVTLMKMGELEEAEAHFQRAIELMPTNPVQHAALADLLLQLGRVEEAASHAEEALRLAPDDPKCHMQMADVEARRGNLTEVVKHMRQAAALDPQDVSVRRQLCQRLLTMEGVEPPVDECREWVRMEPESPEAHHGLGLAYHRAREYEAAERAFSGALEIRPTYGAARLSLGILYLERGQVAKAKGELERVVRDAPASRAAQTAKRVLADMERRARGQARPRRGRG